RGLSVSRPMTRSDTVVVAVPRDFCCANATSCSQRRPGRRPRSGAGGVVALAATSDGAGIRRAVAVNPVWHRKCERHGEMAIIDGGREDRGHRSRREGFPAERMTIPGIDPVRHFFTVDVEEYFQVNAFDDVITRDMWSSFPSRVSENVDRVLDLLARYGARGTFFSLGWVA